MVQKDYLWKNQHHQTTKPRSLLQKSRLESIYKNFEQNHGFILLKYANFSASVIWYFYRLRRLLLRKNISKRQDRCLLHRKEASKDIWNFWPESWVNPLKICKCFDYSKMSFLWCKKTTFEKTNIIKLQNQGLSYRKVDLKVFTKILNRIMGSSF